ncbi:MAG: serine/threonine protein kinase [Planctomycetes bacterium]|nr:serine/threonine protein kinase [Planctomycetota bacterium]
MMDEAKLGRLLLERGLLSQEEYDDATRLSQATGRPLGAILVEKSYLSRVQVEDAIAVIEKRMRFCGRCNIAVYVPVVTPEGERCSRCENLLEWREVVAGPQVQELESIVQLTKDDLPQDVATARAIPSRIFGKYILLEELGKGGSGVVQKAWDSMIGEYVALKFMREPSSVPNSVEEAKKQRKAKILDLLQEARAALRLRHEHIVAIRDVGRISGQFYISMEYIEGDTLSDHIRAAQTRGRLSSLYEDPLFYLKGLLDVANAIHYAHTFPKPIVHCDLKPSNILISVSGCAYVMDFGLARALNVPREDDQFVRGTPSYMAPEQLTGRSEDIGIWTDVYGLGGILYELLTGQAVFTGETPDILARTMRDPPQRPSELVRATPEARRHDTTQILTKFTKLETICLRCLAKDPRDRYPTVRMFAEDLESVVAALERRPGNDTDVVPPKLREAQARAEFRRVDDHITQLNLEAALSEADRLNQKRDDTVARDWVADRRKQVQILERFRERLVQFINERRPKLASLQLVGATLGASEILKATPRKLVVFHREKPMEIDWGGLAPAQVVALAELTQMAEPEDRLALGIFCRHARLLENSIGYLTSLIGTALEPAARQFLSAPLE